MSADVTWSASAIRDVRRLPEKVATAVIEFVHGPLAVNLRRLGKQLRFDLAGLHSARRGDFRIIYRIDDGITVLSVEHRSDVYRRR